MRSIWVYLFFFILLLSGCSNTTSLEEKTVAEKPEQWKESTMFETSTGSKAIGVKDKAAILVTGMENYQVHKEFQKYMWLIWGDREKLSQGILEIYGTHQNDKKRQLLHHDRYLANPLHGADANSLSGPTFPKTGLWKIDVVLNGEHYTSFVLNVK